MHLHLQPLGGLAGDMLAAALLHAAPDLVAPVQSWVAGLDLPVPVTLMVEHAQDQGVTGLRFRPVPVAVPAPEHHVSFAMVTSILEGLGLSDAEFLVASRTFKRLADAEAEVHGVAPEEVHFHEVGAWDSLADILVVSRLAAELGITSVSADVIPLGSGVVRTEHGLLPVPAPATARLLLGLEVGRGTAAGESVTPTGAALLHGLGVGRLPERAVAARVGVGLGSRPGPPGHPNLLQCLLLDNARGTAEWETDLVTLLTTDIDDQSPEELAIALEHIAGIAGVLSSSVSTAMGKKGRPTFQVQVMVEPWAGDSVIREIFLETTTLGVRRQELVRSVLHRSQVNAHLKSAVRPGGGETSKVEADALRGIKGAAARAQQRDLLDGMGV